MNFVFKISYEQNRGCRFDNSFVSFEWIFELNKCKPSAVFHIETIYLICSVNKMSGFCYGIDVGLKQVKCIP